MRSNARREVGFLSDNRRINVGVTRAKRHLAVVGDSQTCSADRFLRSLLEHITTHGDYVSAEDFVEMSVAGVSPLTCSEFTSLTEKKSIKAMKSVGNVNAQKVETEKRVEMSDDEVNKFLCGFQSGEIREGFVQLRKDGTLSLTKKKLSLSASQRCGRLLIFPRSFSSFQRMQIHAAASLLSLYHRSSGQGEERFIEVATEPFQDLDQGKEESSLVTPGSAAAGAVTAVAASVDLHENRKGSSPPPSPSPLKGQNRGRLISLLPCFHPP